MEVLKEQFPKTALWIESLAPFIVIRGDQQVIVRFSDGREPMQLSYDKIAKFETLHDDTGFSW